MRLWDEFVTTVDREFKYLEADFGFNRVSTTVPYVIYQSPFFSIQLYWEIRAGFEMWLNIKPSAAIYKGRLSMGLGTLAGLHKAKLSEGFDRRSIRTKEKMEAAVKELGELLLKHGSPLFRGDYQDLKWLEKCEKPVEDFGRRLFGKAWMDRH